MTREREEVNARLREEAISSHLAKNAIVEYGTHVFKQLMDDIEILINENLHSNKNTICNMIYMFMVDINNYQVTGDFTYIDYYTTEDLLKDILILDVKNFHLYDLAYDKLNRLLESLSYELKMINDHPTNNSTQYIITIIDIVKLLTELTNLLNSLTVKFFDTSAMFEEYRRYNKEDMEFY